MDYLKNESCKKQSVQLKYFLDLAPNINFDENENKKIFYIKVHISGKHVE